MIKLINFAINLFVLPALLMLVLGPVISCGQAGRPQNVDHLAQEEVACEQLFDNKIKVKATSETIERAGVDAYELQYFDDKLEISALNENDISDLIRISNTEFSGLPFIEYESHTGTSFSVKQEVYSLQKDIVRLELSFFDDQALVFQVWLEMGGLFSTGEPAQLKYAYLVVPSSAGQRTDDGFYSESVNGNANILMIYDGESIVDSVIGERFVEQSGIYDFIETGVLSEFVSRFNDQALWVWISHLSTPERVTAAA